MKRRSSSGVTVMVSFVCLVIVFFESAGPPLYLSPFQGERSASGAPKALSLCAVQLSDHAQRDGLVLPPPERGRIEVGVPGRRRGAKLLLIAHRTHFFSGKYASSH